METPSWELPKPVDFSIPFCPKHLKFSPIIEREKFKKAVDMKFIKAVHNHLIEKIDENVLLYLKFIDNGGIRFQNNKISYIKNMMAGVPEWEYATDANTLALYHLNEAAGGNATDATGTYLGTAGGTTVSGGKVLSPGRYFDNLDDQIVLSGNPSIETSDFSIEAWVNLYSTVTGFQNIMQRCQIGYASNYYGWHFGPRGDQGNVMGFERDIGDTSTYMLLGTTVLTTLADVYQHWAGVYKYSDGATKIYLNGGVEASGTTSVNTSIAYHATYDGGTSIGSRVLATLGWIDGLKGDMDEVRVSNIVRTIFGGIAPPSVII